VLIPNELKVGDRIIIGRYVGADFVFEGETYKIMPENQVYAVVEEK
jgi:co-chaperonin GroES (HSP10)